MCFKGHSSDSLFFGQQEERLQHKGLNSFELADNSKFIFLWKTKGGCEYEADCPASSSPASLTVA